MKKYIALCSMLCSIYLLTAQFQVQYTHVNPLKFSLEDFNKIRILSANDQASVRVRYALLDDKKKKVCEVQFKLLPMKRGMNQLNYVTGELVWHNSPFRELLMKNQLVSGNFQLCVAVSDVVEALNEADDCFEVELQSKDIQNDLNLNPIELQSPAHKDTIEEIRPLLTWIPPSPTYQGTQYQVLLVEKRDNQTCTEALNNNLPIVYKKDMISNILNYPVEAPSLQKGHKYCWRASAHKDLKEYSRSEDWEFLVRGEELGIKSYHFIDDLVGKLVFYQRGENKFFIDNMLNENWLDYSIKNSENPNYLINSITNPIKISYGINLIEFMDSFFTENGSYTVSLRLNSKIYNWTIKN